MKKTVAVFIVLFILSMGIMVGWGFIDKQTKENQIAPTPSTTPSDNAPAGSSQSSSSSTSPATSNVYTLYDLSQHKTQYDCWIAINGNVYDVSKFLDQHPGGADLILMVCGKDATQAFKTQGGRGGGHSKQAEAQLANYLIGKLN